MNLDEPFGKLLKRMRHDRGWTLRQMAEKAGSNFAYLSQLEAGIAKPSEELVQRMAEAFGLKDEECERLIFIARGIPAQIQDIKERFPNVSPQYLRRALNTKKEGK
jgi:transcriptional regulator with XRE-family HTH domain